MPISPAYEWTETATTLTVTAQCRNAKSGATDVYSSPFYVSANVPPYFLELDRGHTRLGAAGKIETAAQARACLEQGLDFVTQGRSAILHHDFPRRCEADPNFTPAPLPVTPAHLAAEGLSPTFVNYMRRWEGFVTGDEA